MKILERWRYRDIRVSDLAPDDPVRALFQPCIGCSEPFMPMRSNQLRCSPDCGRSVGRKRKGGGHATRQKISETREFIGVDGEGVTDSDGTHRYVLLTVGKESLHKDGAALSTLDIFRFLYRQFEENKDAAFVGFYLGYDFAQWLRDLPAERAVMLLSGQGIAKRKRRLAHLPPFPVEYEGWEFDLLGMRRLRLRPAGIDAGWLTICDVGSFFQTSFLKAINPRQSTSPIVSESEYALISSGKDGRSEHRFSEEMIRYNVLECEVLARLMAQQRDGLLSEGIRLHKNQWIGPGQAAAAWFGTIGLPKAKDVNERTSPLFRDAARQAYFGGWFEIMWHGLAKGASWSYDINSAYPKIMASLPCLRHGRFINGSGVAIADYRPGALPYPATTLVRASLAGSHPIVGAALHRTPKGKVLRPHNTSGWFWLFEVEAGLKAGFIDRCDIEQYRTYVPCAICEPPLKPIEQLYLGRLAVGKKTPAGRAKRLIYNSGYGKNAQSVGNPTYGNAIWASMITAGCRTMIVEAIAAHPTGARDLLMVATDSVTFRTRHTGLELDEQQLGAWSESEHHNQTFFMPGVYWDDETRKRLATGDDPTLKSRGISARDLARRIGVLDRAWDRHDRDGWPRLVLPISFQLVSPRQALARNTWDLCGTVVRDGKRIINSDPMLKRHATRPGRSRPIHRVTPAESTPYERHFGEEMDEMNAMEFGDHPDMPIGSMMPALFR